MSSNFFEALHQIASEKGIQRDYIEEIVEIAMLSAYKKQYGNNSNVSILFDRDQNNVTIVSKKMAVNNPRDNAEEISIEELKKKTPNVKLGDLIEVEEDPFKSFGRIAAQTAKQVIVQKIKEAEKDIIYNDFKDKEGDLINGYYQRKIRDSIYVDLGKTEGILPRNEQSPLDHFKTGDRIKALVSKVQKNSKGPSIILSRAHPKFIEKLFEMEIPEVYDSVVKIVNIVREVGFRTKVAVISNREDVDSVGACVGMKGIRIQSIVREVEGEKIDIVKHSSDKEILAINSLTPARVKEIIPTKNGGVIAVVDEDQYRLAIGKGGHNARLSSKLCGFNIDIKTEGQYHEFLSSDESQIMVEQLFSDNDNKETPLEELPELGERIINLLEAGGIFSIEALIETSYEDLRRIDSIGEKTANKILDILSESVEFEEEEISDVEDEDEDEKNSKVEED